jgi:protocatechuate 3,4-dioxygenase beta subunit
MGLISGGAHSLMLQAADGDLVPGTTPVTQKAMDDMFRQLMMKGNTTCVRTEDAPEGPFYYESSALRRAIAEGHAGVPLRLGVNVSTLTIPSGCSPLVGAIVDVWQADAEGMYSNVGSDVQVKDTVGQTFLRGHQVTDQNGRVEFDTIVPGWELVSMIEPVHVGPRTPHIHVRVFYERQIATTQLFLPDDLMDQVFAGIEPYRSHRLMTAPALDKSYERIRNADDLVFNLMHGQPMGYQREGKGLVANASIAMATSGGRGLKSYFR